ncbi:MAG: hypothetical protein PUC34_02200 [Paludibacteraceae bacterium]|nr:hypothetical protein [Paludibacteraceae bacterium]
MDFERAAIKTLFYDYPVEHAVQVIENGDEGYMKVFPQIARWRDPAFTISEMDALKRRAVASCEKDNAENILKLLQQVASAFLEISENNEPVVQFEHLLRWQELVSFIGEDMLTIPYLANKDYKGTKRRKTFTWPDVLPHNGETINKVLQKGLTDVHAHFQASVDVFGLNWIAMMNETDMNHLLTIERLMKIDQELEVKIPGNGSEERKEYAITNMIVAAAYIRVMLWNILNGYSEENELSIKKVARILDDDVERVKVNVSELREEYASLRGLAAKDALEEVLDYVIPKLKKDATRKDEIFAIYSGERRFLYQLFYAIQEGRIEIQEHVPMVYLYLLIKNHIRKLFVQNNHLVGFENFQEYQNRKQAAERKTPIAKHHAQFVIQTTTLPNTDDHMEGRVSMVRKDESYDEFEQRYVDEYGGCGKGVFSKGRKMCKKSSLTLVHHFIKSKDYREGLREWNIPIEDVARHASLREKVFDECEYIIRLHKKQRNTKGRLNNLPRLTGIDAAGNELYCRPEVFAHAYRYCRQKGLVNQTYHVGEDYLDLADGLRAIDEAVRFLELDKHCRIGHALALGTDAKKYYESRHFHSLLPRQNYLDDCVWLYMRGIQLEGRAMAKNMQRWLKEQAKRMYEKIGYDKMMPFDMERYWRSMQLRGIDVESIRDDRKGMMSDWEWTAHQRSEEVKDALQDEDIVFLYELYHRNRMIKRNGMEVIDVRWEQKLGIIRLVKRLQQNMQKKIMEKGIAIESNPTSNYKIGRFVRYDELPLLQFKPMTSTGIDIRTSINTDDRGVFATSIAREYSLIGLALQKLETAGGRRVYSDLDIITYLNDLRENGKKMCFK